MAAQQGDSPPTNRGETHAELLQEALERPGVLEVLRVYEDWRRADRGLDSYRAATREPHRITTTDHANQR